MGICDNDPILPTLRNGVETARLAAAPFSSLNEASQLPVIRRGETAPNAPISSNHAKDTIGVRPGEGLKSRYVEMGKPKDDREHVRY